MTIVEMMTKSTGNQGALRNMATEIVSFANVDDGVL